MTAARDPAFLAIVANRLETVAREMMNTLLRTARSGVLNTARDFSCAILTADSELLVFAESLPIHVGGMELESRALMRIAGAGLSPGDAYLNNSPYDGGTHHADHTILVPVFAGEEHALTVCVKAHQADIGNARPTTYAAAAADLYEEGAVNMPCVRVQRDYADVADIVRICKRRIRVPDQWYGDFLSAIGAARIGERALMAFCDKYGVPALREFAGEWFAYSERRTATELEKLPLGSWTGHGRHDPFPGAPDGVPVNATIAIAAAGRLTVDLTRNVDCLPCGLNLSEATARSAALIGVFNALDPGIPMNSGSMRRIDVLLRENCAVGIPRHPASCSLATTHLADRVTNVVSTTMAELRPDYGQAEGGLGIPAGRAVISGSDARQAGAPYVNQIFLGTGGGPATSGCDGWMTYFTPVNGGMCLRDSVEVDEQKYPIVVDRLELVVDSGGAGRYRGGLGTLVEYGPAGADPIVAAYASDGHHFPANGVHGGYPGARSHVDRVDRASGASTPLPLVGEVEIAPGELLRSVSCGGGGFGDPSERDPSALAHDVAEGYVSADAAEAVYGGPAAA
jgi:N-methylhydantoinase B